MPLEPIIPMTDETEGQIDGTPYGLLMYGQAGIYNAVDDRMVTACLSDSTVGVVRPTQLTAGPGLEVRVSAGWLAVASCDDGTAAVVGSRQTHTLMETTGPAQGQAARRDHVWVSTYPNDGRWELNLIPEGQTVGRPGVSIGKVIVPAQANLASQFDFTQMVPTLGKHADAQVRRMSGTAWATLTPDYPIAPHMVRSHRAYLVKAWGFGLQGAQAHRTRWRMGVASSPVIELVMGTIMGARERFFWEAEGLQQVAAGTGFLRSKLNVTVTRYTNQAEAAQAGYTSKDSTLAATRCAWGNVAIPREWATIQIRACFNNASTGQNIECIGTTYETYEPYRE